MRSTIRNDPLVGRSEVAVYWFGEPTHLHARFGTGPMNLPLGLVDRMPVVDADSHVTEPPDLWTSRISEDWRHLVPAVHQEERNGSIVERWRVGERALVDVAEFAVAGWREPSPSHPLVLADADPGAWNPVDRLRRLDEYGVYAQVLYPNLLGFYSHVFLDQIPDIDAVNACVRAYNDFLTDFASEDPKRFVPIMALPFWDLPASLEEVRRCAAAGHRGFLFSNAPEKVGLPALRDSHWDPLWALASDLGQSVNFHIGFMADPEEVRTIKTSQTRADYTKATSLAMLNSNAAAIAEVAVSGICHRFPTLNIVSVESGFGWLPYWTELLDWEWLNAGAARENPHMELPSHYINRQVHGTFWFEAKTIQSMLHLMPNNVMFETDYPHPTSLSPGPASVAESPRTMLDKSLAGVPEELIRKALYANAERVYHLDLSGFRPADGAVAPSASMQEGALRGA